MNSDITVTTQATDALIANGRRLVGEVNQLLARLDQLLAEHHIDPTTHLEALRREGGEEAVAKLEGEVSQLLKQIDSEIIRDRLHSAGPTDRPAARRRIRPTV